VVERLEVENSGRAHAAQLAKVVFAAHRRVGMHEVRKLGEQGAEALLGLGEAALEGGRLLLDATSFGHVGLALLGRELLSAAGLVLLAPAVHLLEFGLKLHHPLARRDRRIEVHRDAALTAALGDLFATVGERSRVQHRADREAQLSEGSQREALQHRRLTAAEGEGLAPRRSWAERIQARREQGWFSPRGRRLWSELATGRLTGAWSWPKVARSGC